VLVGQAGIVSTLLTDSFAHVRLRSRLACLSSLADIDQITRPILRKARYALSLQELKITILLSRT
jgi:hypothetical protein